MKNKVLLFLSIICILCLVGCKDNNYHTEPENIYIEVIVDKIDDGVLYVSSNQNTSTYNSSKSFLIDTKELGYNQTYEVGDTLEIICGGYTNDNPAQFERIISINVIANKNNNINSELFNENGEDLIFSIQYQPGGSMTQEDFENGCRTYDIYNSKKIKIERNNEEVDVSDNDYNKLYSFYEKVCNDEIKEVDVMGDDMPSYVVIGYEKNGKEHKYISNSNKNIVELSDVMTLIREYVK